MTEHIKLSPKIGEEALRRLCGLAERLQQAIADPARVDAAEGLINAEAIAPGLPEGDRLALIAASHLLADLMRQGYTLASADVGGVCLEPPRAVSGDAEKERKRRQLHVERDAQLAQPSVQSFIRSMEAARAPRLPITALMRDGAELAASLEAAAGSPEALAGVVDPYLQFIQGEERCEHTGLKLRDIWRYFRHTWANAYKTVPGRSMMLLVRDRAAAHHPVIGLAAISSAAVQIRDRDLWIGWHPESMGKGALVPSDALAAWAERVVVDGLANVYTQDFIDAGILAVAELEAPPESAIVALRELSTSARRSHHEDDEVDTDAPPDPQNWAALALTPLFRSKRALVLAELLELRRALNEAWRGEGPSEVGMIRLGETADGRKVLRRLLRKAKSDRVGLHLADITVCGALPPYGELLGGKLVCALLMSPEVREAWRERYEGMPSIIASSVAGRAITRPADLVLLTTTSLYGRSSQYNRIAVPCRELGLESEHKLRYERLGMSEGYGTDHFSAATVDALSALIERERGFQRVNSVFGEGVNPRMRKIREGLEVLGAPTDALLLHGNQRELYGVPLAANFRTHLAGLDDAPRYLLPAAQAAEMTAKIAAWWRERWLSGRAKQRDLLERVRAHRAVSHGASVALPQTKQLTLF